MRLDEEKTATTALSRGDGVTVGREAELGRDQFGSAQRRPKIRWNERCVCVMGINAWAPRFLDTARFYSFAYGSLAGDL